MTELGLREKDRDDVYQAVQIKAFRAFLNSYLVKKSRKVDDLIVDLKDGVNLCQFVDLVEHNKKKFTNWRDRPTRKIQMIENLDLSIKHFTNQWGVRLVGIGPEDVHEGNLKLILGLLWSLFRKLRISKIDENDKSSAGASMEEVMMKWVRTVLADYNLPLKDFKTSFNDGMAFSALIHKFNPVFLDYEKMEKSFGEDAMRKRLTDSFAIAESKMSIPQLLEADDCVKNDVDERSVLLYVSMFYHAFASEEERRRLEAEMGQMETAVADLRAELASLQADRAMVERDLRDVAESQESWRNELKRRAEREEALAAEKAKLAEELDLLRRKVEHAEALAAAEAELYEKTRRLRELEARLEQPGLSDAEKNAIRAEIEKLRAELGVLEKKVGELRMKGDSERLDATGSDATARDELDRELHAFRQRAEKEAALMAHRKRIDARRSELLRLVEGRSDKIRAAESSWALILQQLNEHLEDVQVWRQLEAAPDSSLIALSGSDFVPASEPFQQQLETLIARVRGETGALASLSKRGAEAWASTLASAPALSHKTYRLAGPSVVSGNTVAHTIAAAADPFSAVTVSDSTVKIGSFDLACKDSAEAAAWARVARSRAYLRHYLTLSDSPDARVLYYLASSYPVSAIYLDGATLSAADCAAANVLIRLHSSSLVLISVNGSGLSSAQVDSLLSGVEALPVLTTLRLARNSLSEAVALTKASAPKLANVYLSGCGLTAETPAFHSFLPFASQSRIFDVSENTLGTAGVSALCAAMKGSGVLDQLRFSRTHIDDAVFPHISALLQSAPKVRSLDISHNLLSDAGLVAIDAAVSAHKALVSLNFAHCNFTTSGVIRIYEMVRRAPLIDFITLSDNPVANTATVLDSLGKDGFQFHTFVLRRGDVVVAADQSSDDD